MADAAFPHTNAAVVFFDLRRTLIGGTTRTPSLRPSAIEWLGQSARAGLLFPARRGDDARGVDLLLEQLGIAGAIEGRLVLPDSALPLALPDRRVFKIAAVLAEVATGECLYVSADPALTAAAAAAGMLVFTPEPWVGPPADASHAGTTPSASAPTLLADRAAPLPAAPSGDNGRRRAVNRVGPRFALNGRVVTLDDQDRVIDKGRVLVDDGRIVAVLGPGERAPSDYARIAEFETGGTIYPGLIDLHNHFVYNCLPLWSVPKPYENRRRWARENEYAAKVSLPVRALAEQELSAKALVRYVEAKALCGGTTTGQGIRTRVNGGLKLFKGAMRNAEQSDDSVLPSAGTRVPDLWASPENILLFRGRLDALRAYFYHLAEGTDVPARETYLDLEMNDLVQGSLVGIHCLGLRAEDFKAYAARGAKVIWSPFSNLLLYGKTLSMDLLRSIGPRFAIGCDWSPTGSKNLLHELKVARWEAKRQGADLTDRDLVRAVTAQPAQILAWGEHLGQLRPGFLADLIVLGGDGIPYTEVVEARERQIALVVVDGEARYGEPALMSSLQVTPEALESATIDGVARSFAFATPDSPLNDLGLARATKQLQEACVDLPGFRARAAGRKAHLLGLGIEDEGFTVELDNEWVSQPGDPSAPPVLMADWDQMAASVDLDPLWVDEPLFWERLGEQSNIDRALVQSLRSAYGY
jgi:5-methylthioadenosine/S-adenosylhomocysteine deaminase